MTGQFRRFAASARRAEISVYSETLDCAPGCRHLVDVIDNHKVECLACALELCANDASPCLDLGSRQTRFILDEERPILHLLGGLRGIVVLAFGDLPAQDRLIARAGPSGLPHP